MKLSPIRDERGRHGLDAILGRTGMITLQMSMTREGELVALPRGRDALLWLET